VEDQQASTVKGEEELSPELKDEAPEVQDIELEASPEADLDSAAEGEEAAEAEEPAEELEEAVAEEEEAAEAEEPAEELEEAVAEDEEAAEAEEPAEELEEAVAEEEEVAEEELAAEPEEPTEEEPAAEEEPEALADLSQAEAAVNGNDGQVAAMVDELAPEVEAEAPEQRVAEPDDGREWYVVHCYSGYENKVRHNLEQRIETMDMKGKIFDVVVPTEEEMEVKEGKRRTIERRVFPGYILVQMIMDEDSWYVVRNTPGVTGFVGMGNDPTPLRPEEVSQIVKRMEADAPRIKVTYDVGQKVRIIDGPFNDFIGTVDDIDMDKAKVRVMVSFFGRETPVELDFLQVEKA